MAHFLEHLVFKGGEKYPTYRDVNEAAERIGAVLNAYTSHDLVAFHITARAKRALEAADLLTDFVGRPQIDADEIDRERGVVVQEIARANDQPAVIAEHLIDEAAFGDHPLGRPVLGTTEHLRTRSRATASSRSAPPLVARAGRRVRRRQPRLAAGTMASSTSCSGGSRRIRAGPLRARSAVLPQGARARARLQPVPPADVLSARDRCQGPAASAPR